MIKPALLLLTYVAGLTAGSFLLGGEKPRVELLVTRTSVTNQDGVTTVEATPYVAPPMIFNSVGGPPPMPKEVLFCGLDIGQTKFVDHNDVVETLACEGGRKLTLVQVDFK